jgi:hypothetical protein
MAELLALEDPPALTDVATSGDAEHGVIEVEAVLSVDREGGAVDRLLDAFDTADAAVARAAGTDHRRFDYRREMIRLEYL